MTTILDDIAAHLGREVEDDGRLSLHLVDSIAAWLAGRAFSEGRDIVNAPRHALSPLVSGLLDDIVREVAATRLTEIDDIHRASCTTCGSIIVPVVMLLAAETKADGATLARAMVHGTECVMRLGMAARGPDILAKGIWPTYLTAPFGAAAAASILLGLDARQRAVALALALLQTSGTAGGHPHGKSARWLLAGYGARAGVAAAMLAHDGYDADRTLLDGDFFTRTHGIALDMAPLRELTPLFHETSMKPWVCAKQTTSAIAAFQSLLRDGLDSARIARIEVAVPSAYKAMIGSRPPGRLGRIVNVGWQFGLVVHAPDAMFSLDRDIGALAQPVEALAAKVEVVADPSLDPLYPRRWPARVTVRLDDGTERSRTAEDAPGDPAMPLDVTAVLDKLTRVSADFADLFRPYAGKQMREIDVPALLRAVVSSLA